MLIYFCVDHSIFIQGGNPLPVLAIKLTSASLLILIIQYALHATQRIAQLNLEREQIQSENYLAQLQVLRQKVDPHFLFNSMNTLRTMVRSHHSQTEDFIIHLSGFYRQTMKLNDSSVVLLEEELEVLKSYLFLMEIRNQGKVKIEMNLDQICLKRGIPSLSLQIIAENCFKHNQMSVDHPLVISICDKGTYYLSIKNNMQPKLVKEGLSGYGLENIRKRYELLGEDRGILIDQTTDYFEVRLKLI
ncbi:MAG: sensor histidine kinase [Bacteroidales bacterium]